MKDTTISIKKFLDLLDELEKLNNDVDKDILITSVLSNNPVETVMSLSIPEYAALKKQYDISKILDKKHNSNVLIHNEIEYEFRVDLNKMTVQEWADISLVEKISDRKERVLKTMCLLAWTNDEEKYDGEYKLSRIDTIKEMDAGEVYAISSFFLQNLESLKTLTQRFIRKTKELQIKKGDIVV